MDVFMASLFPEARSNSRSDVDTAGTQVAQAENGLIDQHPRDKDSSEAGESSKKDRLEEENARFVNKIHVNFVCVTLERLEPL